MNRADINVTTPCTMSWDAMKAEGPKAVKRFCGECKKHVHDLSKMSKSEARALLASETTEGLCVRYLYDEKGDVVFAGDARLLATNALTRMARAKRFVAATAALALPMSLNACMGAAMPREVAPVPTVSQTAIDPQPDASPNANANANANANTSDGGAAPSTPAAK